MTTRISKRLILDIQAAKEPELQAQGIYYKSDESDIRKGKVFIICHKNTPYEGLFASFDFVFPEDYPFLPPQVIWKTHDGCTRFHPQLYIGGKVCLSILNTWSGPGWTSSMNLVCVLQILQSLFVENPMTCEPGFEKGKADDPKYVMYSKYVQHQVHQYMIRKFIEWKEKKEFHIWLDFENVVEEQKKKTIEFLSQTILKKAEEPEETMGMNIYGQTLKTQWSSFKNLLPKLDSLP